MHHGDRRLGAAARCARRAGVSERSLRCYGREDLLSAERPPGGHREYTSAAVDRVRRIQELYAAGLCGSKIAKLLPCMRDSAGGPSETADTLLVSELTVERDRIDRVIGDLRRSRTLLDAVITAASRTAPSRTADPIRQTP
ncbi:MerR family transcriptional regulator [Streptomyces incanus]|uniref:MerR family transcriptional regulator n=1 Tax=Streptomyces incanus TaxID=887453 RepID=A0ABW0XS08_9ACTN